MKIADEQYDASRPSKIREPIQTRPVKPIDNTTMDGAYLSVATTDQGVDPPRFILSKLNDVEESVERLYRVTDGLQGRLECISGPVKDTEPTPYPAPSSTVGNRLARIEDRLLTIICRIDNITNALEI